MPQFLQKPVVEYVCACGILNPLSKLYFCRHCLKLRCGFCVCHEVDSHFCSNCLENIPSTEAKHKKNRCSSCFDCPSCQHTLSPRAITVQLPRKPEDGKEPVDAKAISRKMYYLSCLACRWTSRDVGIPDQTVATGSWPEAEYGNATRFALLMEYYQSVVLQEKQERQDYWRRKTPKQHKYPSLTDRTGLTVSMIRRQIGFVDKNPPKAKPSKINPSIATDIVEDLPADIFTNTINLKSITTIKQRLCQPSSQPYSVNNLFPQHKSLSIKRSLRCRQCEHNVIKPEYNPGSIKYRIQLFGSYHVPELRLIKSEPLMPNNNSSVILKLMNPTMHDMTITIMDLPTYEEESLLIEEMRKGFEKSISVTGAPSLNASISRQPSLSEEPRYVDKRSTGAVTLPDSSFILLHRDDSAEFDEEVQAQYEDPKFVVWRRSNKVGIKLNVVPNSDLKANTDVIVGFTMQYTYVNTVTNASDKKDPQKHALTSRIYINVGKVQSAA